MPDTEPTQHAELGRSMCPHCGALFAPCSLIPNHGDPHCLGSQQIPRCPESDRRRLWNGQPNPHHIDGEATP